MQMEHSRPDRRLSAEEIENVVDALTNIVGRLRAGPTKQSILTELMQLREFAYAARAATAAL
jgi:hypothetical protein